MEETLFCRHFSALPNRALLQKSPVFDLICKIGLFSYRALFFVTLQKISERSVERSLLPDLERETETDTETETERDRKRQRERVTERDRERQRETERDRERQRDRKRETETDRDRER